MISVKMYVKVKLEYLNVFMKNKFLRLYLGRLYYDTIINYVLIMNFV